MAGPGNTIPKPEGQRRRRNAPLANTLKLPAEGRRGRAPRWPLPPEVARQATLGHLRDAEVAVRAELEVVWGSGDAEKARALDDKASRLKERAVALEAETEAARKAQAALWRELWRTPQAVEWERLGWTREVAQYALWKVRAEQGNLEAAKEARQQADRLGLTPMAMLRLRWTVDEPAAAAEQGDVAPAGVTDLRDRFRAVE